MNCGNGKTAVARGNETICADPKNVVALPEKDFLKGRFGDDLFIFGLLVYDEDVFAPDFDPK